ncbi:nicastrin domain-containing protein [Ditylenchus destructor]|uniref:Nicastrin n=1 Tax=Ditylenchus destructor TaxID=166010 RepID=A0AAD4NGD6_9BILA|nr:nicastrin domain-containing protein [Ditylenchus destructor]
MAYGFSIQWLMCFILILIQLPINACFGVIDDQINIKLSSDGVGHHCFRMLNGTTTIGCQSDRSGNSGAVMVINQKSDIVDALTSLSFGVPGIIAVVGVKYMTRELVNDLRTSNGVLGILLYSNETEATVSQFSEDAACPNEQFSFYRGKNASCHEWNQMGAIHPSGLKFLNFDKPIYYMSNHTETDILINRCYTPFNKKKSSYHCMARMTQFMHADGNADICMRRYQLGPHLCDELHDRNVFAMLPALSRENRTADVFVIASRMDSFSSFTSSRGGDLSVLTSIVSLLAVAEAVGQNLALFLHESTMRNRQLLLSFFHGESLGYVGSSRMVWEMGRHEFPNPPKNFTQPRSNVKQLSIDDISLYWEIQQLDKSNGFFMQTDFGAYSKHRNMLDDIVKLAKQMAQSRGYSIEFAPNSPAGAPPSSYHSFLKASPTIPGVVLSSFGFLSYKSGHINSIFDTDVENDKADRQSYVGHITAAANVTLSTVLDYVLEGSPQRIRNNFAINQSYVEELMSCFFDYAHWECPLFETLLNSTYPGPEFSQARNLYIGTTDDSLIRMLVQALLIKSLGEKEPTSNVSNKSQCNDLNKNQDVFNYVWQNDPLEARAVCYQTSVYQTTAKSPAFDIQDYDFKSGQFSSWVESQWELSNILELYLADRWTEVRAVITAMTVIAFSIPLKFILKEAWFMDTGEPPAAPQQL